MSSRSYDLPLRGSSAPRQSIPTFRFWTLHNGQLVRLALRHHEPLYRCRTDDDGFERAYRSSEWMLGDEGIYLELEEGGWDCDGSHRETTRLFCPYRLRHTLDAAHGLQPAWTEVDRSAFDSYAQAANC